MALGNKKEVFKVHYDFALQLVKLMCFTLQQPIYYYTVIKS